MPDIVPDRPAAELEEMYRPGKRVWKKITLGILRACIGRHRPHPPLQPRDLHRVLLLRYDRIGDVVITTPLIDALKRLAPDVEIDVLGSPANKALLEGDPRINLVHLRGNSLMEWIRVIRTCRRRRYDVVFQLLLNRTTLPAVLARLLGGNSGRTVGNRVPYHEELFDYAVPLPPNAHFAERTLALLTGSINRPHTPAEQIRYSLMIPEGERAEATDLLKEAGLHNRPFVYLNISAGNPSRELSPELNIAIAEALLKDGWQVAIAGAPEAHEKVAAIARSSGAVPLRFGSLHQAIAAIEAAELIVTPDTAVVHLASAVGTPVAAIFGSGGHPEGWSPLGTASAILQGRTDGTIILDPEEVVAAARNLSVRSHPQHPPASER